MNFISIFYFVIPDFVIECEKGNTSRDNLLQCISTSTEFGDAMLWSSACNRAVRELYPNSQAQRKGKYKKYPLDNRIT